MATMYSIVVLWSVPSCAENQITYLVKVVRLLFVSKMFINLKYNYFKKTLPTACLKHFFTKKRTHFFYLINSYLYLY